MADSETPVVVTDAPVDIQVEVEEPQQELKPVEKLNETQEQAAPQEESVDVEQEKIIDVEQEAIVGDDSVSAKQDEPTDIKQEQETKQEETTADVKEATEIKDDAAVDVTTKDSKTTTDKKTTGGGHKKKVYENKSKFDPTVLPDSDDPEEIRKQVYIKKISPLYFMTQTKANSLSQLQVEFYFSESNLSSDKFLFSLIGGKENKPVPLNLIASFKRMRRFPNKGTIIDALKESALVELSGDPGEETVKRKTPVEADKLMAEDRRFGVGGGHSWPKSIVDFEPNQDPTIHRSIYAVRLAFLLPKSFTTNSLLPPKQKGFSDETATTQMDIEKFFEPHGPINAVRLRRDISRKFKKSVFVEFATDELAQNFMALENKPTWEDQELMWLSKLAYVQGKVQDIKDGKVQAKNRPTARPPRGSNHNASHHKHNGNRGNDRSSRGGGGGRGRGGRGRGGRGGRGHSNDRRGGDRDNKRGDREGFKKEDNGIPKIKSSTDTPKSEPTDASAQNGASKRKATNEGAHEVKKPKVGETAT